MILVAATSVYAQQNKPDRKKIEVNGTAEIEVIPDEIYLRIALKEYKDGSRKVTINQLEEQLVRAVSRIDLPKKNLTVDNIYGYNWNWKKKKSEEFLATKSFKLKLDNVKKINELIDLLDAEGINSMGVAEVSHSQLEKYKRDLRVEALKNAKAKASYMLDALGEKLGGAIEIQEVDRGQPMPMYRAEVMYATKTADADGYQSDLEFKNITLKTEVRAVFEIL